MVSLDDFKIKKQKLKIKYSMMEYTQYTPKK